MSNSFKFLDSFFPCGDDRLSGEVVSVQVSISYHGVCKGSVSWKRKAWYVNASKNAWHMHRGLCREIRENYSQYMTEERLAFARSQILRAVKYSYLHNYATSQQYHSFDMEISEGEPLLLINLEGGTTVPLYESTLVGVEFCALAVKQRVGSHQEMFESLLSLRPLK